MHFSTSLCSQEEPCIVFQCSVHQDAFVMTDMLGAVRLAAADLGS